MKKVFALLLAFCLLCGCQKGPDAAQIAEGLSRLYIAGDSAVTEMLSDIDVEGIKDDLETGLYQQMKSNLEDIGVSELDEEMLNVVIEELMSARKRIPVSVELTSEDKETAVVNIRVGSIDLSAIDAEAAEKALAAMNDAAEDSDTYRRELLNAYLEALQGVLAEFDGYGEESTIEVQFVKTKGLWLPVDMQEFITELGKAIRR